MLFRGSRCSTIMELGLQNYTNQTLPLVPCSIAVLHLDPLDRGGTGRAVGALIPPSTAPNRNMVPYTSSSYTPPRVPARDCWCRGQRLAAADHGAVGDQAGCELHP